MTFESGVPFLDQLVALHRAGDSTATEDAVSTQMVRTICNVYLRLMQGDYVGATDQMTDDFSLEILGPPEIPMTGNWRGKETVAIALEKNFSQLEQQNPQVLGVTSHADAVLVMGRETGRVRATGCDYDVHWVQWFTFRGPLLCRMLEIFDSQEISPAFHPTPPPSISATESAVRKLPTETPLPPTR